MAETITYYAIIDEFSSRDRPGGVLRRVMADEGQVDEVFSRDLKWEFSPLLYGAERGDTMFDFVPISEEEAAVIVERIRELADPDELRRRACRVTRRGRWVARGFGGPGGRRGCGLRMCRPGAG
jgi:hypothetical protein